MECIIYDAHASVLTDICDMLNYTDYFNCCYGTIIQEVLKKLENVVSKM